MVFPKTRWLMANQELRKHKRYKAWQPDPIPSEHEEEHLGFKYHGYCSRSSRIRAELQIVPMLVGLFWQVEHSALYKPSPELRGVLASLEMKQRTNDVYSALKAFEEEFERLVRNDPASS